MSGSWTHRVAMIYSVGCIVLGRFLAYKYLYHHKECDMTWSQRRFLELPLSTNEQTPYRLFKFTDARDLRYRQFFAHNNDKVKNLQDNSWCNSHNHSVPILFVPGHAGDYQQARSLGAHAVHMTGRSMTSNELQQALQLLHYSQETVLDIYTVDFNEEWSALHGFYITRQVRFVEQAILRLINACEHYESILLVGHSIGGLVSLAAAKAQPTLVNTIVTLATPHQKLVTYEPQLWQWHKSLGQPLGPVDFVLLSVSGGLRDELVSPETTQHRFMNTFYGFSLMGPDFMELAHDEGTITTPYLGMDHRAIVWCHNLLAPLRNMLVILGQGRRQKRRAREILQTVLTTVPKHALEFKVSMHRQYHHLQNDFGFIGATVIELSALGNIDLLVFFFVFLGTIKIQESSRGRKTSEWTTTTVLLVIYVVYAYLRGIFHSLRAPNLHSILVAALSAQALYLFFRFILIAFICGRAFRRASRLSCHVAAIGIAASISVLSSRLLKVPQETPNAFGLGVFLVSATATLGLTHLSSISPHMQSLLLREASFAAWSIPVVLILTFADLVVLIRYSESLGVIGKLCPLVCVRFLVGGFAESTFNVDESLPVGIICASTYYFVSGNIDDAARIYGLHPVGLFVNLLIVADILRVLLTFGFRRPLMISETKMVNDQQLNEHTKKS
ncbi:glycosylphosphatidylinositol deacylase [Fistulifera solaris]|uniref:GPI inositol-deacylase n=1 Tax=Fistulifera solaris TaxID=1519565 RepID=A0A1Z5JQX5_FISSO|nr:glycosylphosphatidylinositol deacylase [Fistulifera solaris]|eukprot:GAX16417.1 glycosylphosphatidylinositol deacylase [Fistulifera solaris]